MQPLFWWSSIMIVATLANLQSQWANPFFESKNNNHEMATAAETSIGKMMIPGGASSNSSSHEKFYIFDKSWLLATHFLKLHSQDRGTSLTISMLFLASQSFGETDFFLLDFNNHHQAIFSWAARNYSVTREKSREFRALFRPPKLVLSKSENLNCVWMVCAHWNILVYQNTLGDMPQKTSKKNPSMSILMLRCLKLDGFQCQGPSVQSLFVSCNIRRNSNRTSSKINLVQKKSLLHTIAKLRIWTSSQSALKAIGSMSFSQKSWYYYYCKTE